MEIMEEDVWAISTWKTDIPGKLKYIKDYFLCLQFPSCCQQVLIVLDKYFAAYNTGNLQNPALFVTSFLDDLIEKYLYHAVGAAGQGLSATLELRLLEVMCTHFQSQSSEFVRYCVFDILFGVSKMELKGKKFDRRIDLLTRLVSMAVALQSGNVLDCMAWWIQKHRLAADFVINIASSIVDDYTCLVPASIPFLESVASISPQLACQLIIAHTAIYPMKPRNRKDPTCAVPPDALIKVIVKWISQDPEICLTKPHNTFLTLPSLHNPPATNPECTPLPICPVLGLVHWTVLHPLMTCQRSEDRGLYSELQLGILQALVKSGRTKLNPNDEMEMEPGEVMDESDMLRHLLKGAELKELTDVMISLIDRLTSSVDVEDHVKQERVALAVDRFAQIVQVSIATGCLSCHKDELLAICKSLPSNRLLETVITKLDKV